MYQLKKTNQYQQLKKLIPQVQTIPNKINYLPINLLLGQIMNKQQIRIIFLIQNQNFLIIIITIILLLIQSFRKKMFNQKNIQIHLEQLKKMKEQEPGLQVKPKIVHLNKILIHQKIQYINQMNLKKTVYREVMKICQTQDTVKNHKKLVKHKMNQVNNYTIQIIILFCKIQLHKNNNNLLIQIKNHRIQARMKKFQKLMKKDFQQEQRETIKSSQRNQMNKKQNIFRIQKEKTNKIPVKMNKIQIKIIINYQIKQAQTILNIQQIISQYKILQIIPKLYIIMIIIILQKNESLYYIYQKFIYNINFQIIINHQSINHLHKIFIYWKYQSIFPHHKIQLQLLSYQITFLQEPYYLTQQFILITNYWYYQVLQNQIQIQKIQLTIHLILHVTLVSITQFNFQMKNLYLLQHFKLIKFYQVYGLIRKQYFHLPIRVKNIYQYLFLPIKLLLFQNSTFKKNLLQIHIHFNLFYFIILQLICWYQYLFLMFTFKNFFKYFIFNYFNIQYNQEINFY